jgi:hypothetical protein
MELLISFVLPTSKKAESDQSFCVRVSAKNDAEALVLAKRALTIQYPHFNFRKIWCWFVEGKPNRK